MATRIPLILFAVGMLSGQQPDKDPGKEKEAALGSHLASEIRKTTTAVQSETIQSYVDRLGKELAAQFGGEDVPYQFAVVTDTLGGRTHEPLALPGGYVFISTGLFLAAQDEAEFAGMLAHAMAHIANRDSSRLAVQRHVVNYGSIPLTFIGGWSGANATNGAIPIAFLKSQRTFELEADRQAVRVVSGAGYDPAGFLRYIERTQPPDNVFSALPARAERASGIEQATQNLPARPARPSDEEFKRVQEEIRRAEPIRLHNTPTLRRQ